MKRLHGTLLVLWNVIWMAGVLTSFQRQMDKILSNLLFASTYIDNILVFSSNPKQHNEHLSKVFQWFLDACLTLRGNKYYIELSKATYLGHVFSAADDIAPDPKKTQAIVEWARRTNVATVWHFIGISSYFRCYIANFVQIAAPLHRLTQKGITFDWSQECENAFSYLKSQLSTAPILSFL